MQQSSYALHIWITSPDPAEESSAGWRCSHPEPTVRLWMPPRLWCQTSIPTSCSSQTIQIPHHTWTAWSSTVADMAGLYRNKANGSEESFGGELKSLQVCRHTEIWRAIVIMCHSAGLRSVCFARVHLSLQPHARHVWAPAVPETSGSGWCGLWRALLDPVCTVHLTPSCQQM